ncbi:hypothetical protein [Paenibacillus tundrae]|uniref:Tetrahydromethanopterin S-methyltransferase subunit G n=1 Tax=Paenibacillus tundrae TaxID=528187 RepID=A0ABT9WA62_9BACL|nr:hypothetical protein [Paenibacillus tundrae]MDQ0170143.1 tetrahydromethanopterin S-methyltransferase subunit G [Paenibacillus tundrae]
MRSEQETEPMNERLERMEEKLDRLEIAQQKHKKSPVAKFLIGVGITFGIILVLMMTIGVLQFVSEGS